MHFVRSRDTKNRVIAGEMLNIECGKKIFNNGVLIDDNHHQTCPDIQYEGVRTIIKSNFGILFVPNNNEKIEGTTVRKWVESINITLSEMREESLSLLKKYGRIDAYECIETGENGFTSTRVKRFSENTHTNIVINTHEISSKNFERVFWIFPDMFSANNSQLCKNRFTWAVRSNTKLLIDVCSSVTIPDIDTSIQSYLSICYDPDNWFNTPNIVKKNLTISDIKFMGKFLPIHTFGIIDEKFIDDCRNCFRGSPTKKAKALTNVGKLMNSPNLIKNELESYSFKDGVTNYTPIMTKYRIVYSQSKKGCYSIINILGNSIFASIVMPHSSTAENSFGSHEVSFADVTIDNTIFTPHNKYCIDVSDDTPVADDTPIPNDRCWQCHTPLYDDIYMAFKAGSQLPKGIAICPICAHTNFNHSFKDPTVRKYKHGVSIFSDDMIVGKTKFPRSCADVINMIEDVNISSVIHSMFSKQTKIINVKVNQALYVSPYMISSYQNDHYIGTESIAKACLLCLNDKKNIMKYSNHTIIPICFIK